MGLRTWVCVQALQNMKHSKYRPRPLVITSGARRRHVPFPPASRSVYIRGPCVVFLCTVIQIRCGATPAPHDLCRDLLCLLSLRRRDLGLVQRCCVELVAASPGTTLSDVEARHKSLQIKQQHSSLGAEAGQLMSRAEVTCTSSLHRTPSRWL
jgi:hypothetical protein